MEVHEILGKLNSSVHETMAKVTSGPEDLASLKKTVSEANLRKLRIHQVRMDAEQATTSSTKHITPKNFCLLLS